MQWSLQLAVKMQMGNDVYVWNLHLQLTIE